VELLPLAVITLQHPVGEREADVLLVLVVGVGGEGEAGERGGGEVHLPGRHHAATHASFLAMEGQMIGADKTVTQPVASEKPKTHSINGVLNSTSSKVWLDA